MCSWCWSTWIQTWGMWSRDAWHSKRSILTHLCNTVYGGCSTCIWGELCTGILNPTIFWSMKTVRPNCVTSVSPAQLGATCNVTTLSKWYSITAVNSKWMICIHRQSIMTPWVLIPTLEVHRRQPKGMVGKGLKIKISSMKTPGLIFLKLFKTKDNPLKTRAWTNSWGTKWAQLRQIPRQWLMYLKSITNQL